MHRFYHPAPASEDPALLLTGSEAHHGLHVLRVQRGERVLLLDGRGTETLAEVVEPGRDEIRLTAIDRRVMPGPPCRLSLIQAVPKGKVMEWIVQKATELGVSSILPVLTQRVVVQLDPLEAVRKAAKWQTVAIESIKQCGSPWLPHVEVPVSLEDVLSRSERPELTFVASLADGSRHPRMFFQRFRTQHDRPPRTVSVWVGPEGDFAPAELAAIESAGGLPITLGSLVLRSETAALYCLSVLNYEIQAPIFPV